MGIPALNPPPDNTMHTILSLACVVLALAACDARSTQSKRNGHPGAAAARVLRQMPLVIDHTRQKRDVDTSSMHYALRSLNHGLSKRAKVMVEHAKRATAAAPQHIKRAAAATPLHNMVRDLHAKITKRASAENPLKQQVRDLHNQIMRRTAEETRAVRAVENGAERKLRDLGSEVSKRAITTQKSRVTRSIHQQKLKRSLEHVKRGLVQLKNRK